jgi:hypothetical protein
LDCLTWDQYFRADPRRFLNHLEIKAGLVAPTHVPASTPTTLTYRILAAIAATAIKTVHPIDIQPGLIDSSLGGGPNPALDLFTAIPAELRQRVPEDLRGQPGYRFWIVHRDDVPILAFEQSHGYAWTQHHPDTIHLTKLHHAAQRHLATTALNLLRAADNP